MEQEIIERAKWLYAANAAAYSKYECVKTALYEMGLSYVRQLTEDLRPANVSLGEYIEDLAEKLN